MWKSKFEEYFQAEKGKMATTVKKGRAIGEALPSIHLICSRGNKATTTAAATTTTTAGATAATTTATTLSGAATTTAATTLSGAATTTTAATTAARYWARR